MKRWQFDIVMFAAFLLGAAALGAIMILIIEAIYIAIF